MISKDYFVSGIQVCTVRRIYRDKVRTSGQYWIVDDKNVKSLHTLTYPDFVLINAACRYMVSAANYKPPIDTGSLANQLVYATMDSLKATVGVTSDGNLEPTGLSRVLRQFAVSVLKCGYTAKEFE